MKISIQWKIVGIYLSVVLVIMIVSGTFIILKVEDQYFKKVKSETENTARNIRDILILDGEINFDENRDNMITALKNIITLDEEITIYILDKEGEVQISLGKDYKRGDYVNQNDPHNVVNKSLLSKDVSTTEWNYFLSQSTSHKNSVEHALPILNENNDIEAIIYVLSSSDIIYDNVNSVMQTLSLGSAFALCIAFLFSSVFANMITRPIKELTTSSKLLTQGSFKKIPISSTDEIGQLTQSFNFMATELSRIMRDISSEKNKLERILENMADGVMAFNRQGVLIHANSVCYDMLDQTAMDHRFDFIFPNLGIDISFDDILADAIDYEKGITIQIDYKYINFHFAPYESNGGEREGLTVVMQDVTSQQKLDQMRKDFVANVSHELRTPLTTVKSYTETLMDGAIEDKDMALNFLSVVEKEVDRMTMLVQDLLELSRIDNKQMQLNMEVIDIKSLVQDTIEAQLIQAENKGHTLICEWDKNVEYLVEGDSARIRQIFHNILSNAIKYSPDPGKIFIRIFKNKDIVVQIQDNGLGIGKRDLERIFERFYRVDKARSRQMGGTGLGLSIAKEMVELHGGEIKVSSKIDKGTTVTIYFKAYNAN